MRLSMAFACAAAFPLVVWGSRDGETFPQIATEERATPLQLLMDGPLEAHASGGVTFKMALKNTTGRTVVEKPDGTPVWWLTFGRIIVGTEHIGPFTADEERTFQASWDLRANDGPPVPPGDYFVRGSLKLEYPFKMETGQPLHISP